MRDHLDHQVMNATFEFGSHDPTDRAASFSRLAGDAHQRSPSPAGSCCSHDSSEWGRIVTNEAFSAFGSGELSFAEAEFVKPETETSSFSSGIDELRETADSQDCSNADVSLKVWCSQSIPTFESQPRRFGCLSSRYRVRRVKRKLNQLCPSPQSTHIHRLTTTSISDCGN